MINQFMVDNQSKLENFMNFINKYEEFEGSQFWDEVNDIFWEMEEVINNLRDEKTVVENDLEGVNDEKDELETEVADLQNQVKKLEEELSER